MKKEAERTAPRYFQCEVKSVTDTEEGVKIAGFASTPDIDRVQDIVVPTAFERSIKEFIEEDGAPALLRSHNRDAVVGSIIMKGDEAPKITEKGLFITAIVTDPDTVGKVKRGEMKTFSIGYIPDWNSVKYELRPTDRVEKESGQRLMIEVRIIEQLDWIETSIVSTPANRKALFTLAKSVKELFTSFPSPDMKKKCHYFPEEPVVGKIGDRWVSQKAIDMLEFKGEATHADMVFDSEDEAKAYVEKNTEIKDCDIEEFTQDGEEKYKLVDIELDQKKVDEKKAAAEAEAEEKEEEGDDEEDDEEGDDEEEDGEKDEKEQEDAEEKDDEDSTEKAPEQESGGKSEEDKPEGGTEGEKSLKLTPEVIKSLSDIVALVNPEAAKAMLQDTKAKDEEKAAEVSLYDVVMPLMKMLAEHIGALQKEVDTLMSQPTPKGRTFLASRSRGVKDVEETDSEEKKLDKGFASILREAQQSSGQSVTLLDTDEEKDDDDSDE